MHLLLYYVVTLLLVPSVTNKLGNNHKYFETLSAMIKCVPDDSQIEFLITTICQDKDIHAIYFPAPNDVDDGIKEAFCRHELCRFDSPPKKHVMQAYWNCNSAF